MPDRDPIAEAYLELRRCIAEAHDFLGKPERIDAAYEAFLQAVRDSERADYEEGWQRMCVVISNQAAEVGRLEARIAELEAQLESK